MKLLSLCLFLACTSSHNAKAQNIFEFTFKNGDLLFQDLDCGELCVAIKHVTGGVDEKEFSHVGIIHIINDTTYVIEAIGANVHLTLLEKFVDRSVDGKGNFKIVVGRLKDQFQNLIQPALQFSLNHLGTPYDEAFLYGNGKYYCSELIYDAFLYANNNRPFFELQPMTFKDPDTGKTFEAWKKYYEHLKIPVPEGQAGCNPGGISMSNKLEIVKSFY